MSSPVMTVEDKMREVSVKAEAAGYRVLAFYLGRSELEDVAEWWNEPTTVGDLLLGDFAFRGWTIHPVDEESHFTMDVTEA